MLHYAIIFVIAIIAAVLGFSGIAGAATNESPGSCSWCS